LEHTNSNTTEALNSNSNSNSNNNNSFNLFKIRSFNFFIKFIRRIIILRIENKNRFLFLTCPYCNSHDKQKRDNHLKLKNYLNEYLCNYIYNLSQNEIFVGLDFTTQTFNICKGESLNLKILVSIILEKDRTINQSTSTPTPSARNIYKREKITRLGAKFQNNSENYYNNIKKYYYLFVIDDDQKDMATYKFFNYLKNLNITRQKKIIVC
jgi:hypothetical protein